MSTVEHKCESLNIQISTIEHKCESLNIQISTVEYKCESLNKKISTIEYKCGTRIALYYCEILNSLFLNVFKSMC